ncbi:hypothetical protein BDR04DRAFT_1086181 [Suillus decipiens]|nr:hypothetical protein BDR04DRAFT_1086181 [Suillus decipiens]
MYSYYLDVTRQITSIRILFPHSSSSIILLSISIIYILYHIAFVHAPPIQAVYTRS